ncbi:MAG: glycoside hydrolase family 88 protein [Gemmiger sp.]|nr:glycoside hydrolase family 88 protein [Gemmiger sp.]
MARNLTPITDKEAAAALQKTIAQVEINLPLYTHQCQNNSSVNNIYPTCANNKWTTGFWPGEIWLAFERTGRPCFEAAGQTLVESFVDRIENRIEIDTHDLGFMYSPSCVAAYKLTGNERAKAAALKAADHLITRFHEKGQFLQAWGKTGDAEYRLFIIDCLLNLPLLYWASEVTGDANYAKIAQSHITTCLKNSFRADGSVHHTFFMHPDGTPSHGATCQGYSDDSFWARGQAWGIYGSILSYRYTKEEKYQKTFETALRFYLSHLPEDMVPFWDMLFTDGSDEPRDSSSAAIVACGLLEAKKYATPEKAAEYETLARQMLQSLSKNYAVPAPVPGAGQLLHGTYNKHTLYNTCVSEGIDECTSWGDYYYMEALTRLVNPAWNLYW